MKNLKNPIIALIHSKKINILLYLFFALFLLFFSNLAKAQYIFQITGSSNVASLNSGNTFVYTINYSTAGNTTSGQNVVATINLPTNLVPSDINTFGNSISFPTSQVTNATYNSGLNVVTINYINPLPAGAAGQIQLTLRYLNGTTPNNYAPDLFTRVSFSNPLSTSPVFSDTLNVVSLASNNFTIGKVKNSGGAINDLTIYKFNIGSTASSNGALNLTNPILIDTLAAGVEFEEATAFSGSNAPVYNATDRTVTWTWTSGLFNTNYSSSAYLSVRHPSGSFSLGNNVCNKGYLNGEIPVLPLGNTATSSKNGNVCFNLAPPTPAAICTGGNISAATANWLSKHVLSGTNGNSFSNGWSNTGNTELDSVILTYSIDKSVDVTSVFIGRLVDGLARTGRDTVQLRYKTNTNSTYTLHGTYIITADQTIPISLPSGQYLTEINFVIYGKLPIGGSQSLTYSGNVRTAILGAKDGTPITEGTTYLTNNPGDDGTVITNSSNGRFVYNGTSTNYSNCSGVAEILKAQPVFNTPSKAITNSSSNLRASDTINYRLRIQLGGNVSATDVVFVDTLDSRLNYVAGSGNVVVLGNTIIPVVNGNILTWNLGTLTVGATYTVTFKAEIKPGTLPNTILNRLYVNSSNALFPNGKTASTNITVISNIALVAYKGQNGCDTNFVYYPTNATTQEGGLINYKITVKNQGNVAAKDLTLIDVFPFIGDTRGSQWFPNLVGPVTLADPNSTVYYNTVSNACYTDFVPAVNPPSCNTPVWTLTPPLNITAVKAIKITRTANLAALDSIVFSWPMRVPIGTPANIVMNNTIYYQVSRADMAGTTGRLLPAAPNQVGMVTSCSPVLGSIGNYAWIDVNKNGLQDEAASLGINGIKVYLYGTGADSLIGGIDDVLLDSTFTATSFSGNPGFYKFIELKSGKYYVKFQTTYDNYLLTPTINQAAKVDNNNDANTNGISGLVTINSGLTGQDKDNTTIDAGYYPIGSLGNYVWYDENKNGSQDEPPSNGFNGQKVYLYREISSVYSLIDSTVTANDGSGNPGYYNFVIYDSGNFKVKFPTNVITKILSTQTTTAGLNGNSDAGVLDGFSPVIVMNLMGSGVSKNNPTIDAGYKCNVPVSISGNNNLCQGNTTTLISTNAFSYQWYNASGILVGETNQTLVKNIAGSYYVIVADSGGCYSNNSNTITVTVSPSPTANFTINNPVQCGTNYFDFTNTSTNNLTNNWNFGDNTSATTNNANKVYTTSGYFNVKLVVTNSFGCKDSVTKQVFTGNPTSAFTYVKKCNGEVEFINNSTNANDYEWIFGNGSYCTPSYGNVTHKFLSNNANGVTYNVTLIAKNNNLCADSSTQTITIYPNALAVYSANAVSCNTKVLFNNYSVNATSYNWDFGVTNLTTDTSSLANTSYTYPANGTYNVRLIAKNIEGCGDTLTKQVVVNSNGIVPTANFNIVNISTSCINRYKFVNTSTNGVSYQWVFNDGSVSNLTDASLSFASAGTYSVKLIAKSSSGCFDTITQTVNVLSNSNATLASFTVNNRTTCFTNNSFEFINTSQFLGNGWIPSNEWSFGDGTTDNVNSSIYGKRYSAPGLYTIRLIATGNNGCKDTAYQTVEVLPSPNASFMANTGCGMTAQVSNQTTGAIANIWNFGDGVFIQNNDSAFIYKYKTENFYFISLTAIGANGCWSSTDRGVLPTRAGVPVPFFTYDTIRCSNAIKFNNLTVGGAEVAWNFGDGSPISNVYNPVKAYSVAGTYTVVLTISNGPFCSATYSFFVKAPAGFNIALPKAGLMYNVAACTNTISATDTSLNTTSRQWFFDGVLAGVSPWLTINNPTVGGHELKLIAVNGTCYDTIKQLIVIQETPISSFTKQISTCSRTVLFNSKASFGYTYNWKFNDVSAISDTAQGALVSHTFSTNGTYIVKLTTTNLAGCSADYFDTVIVNSSNNSLNASFKFNNTICNCVCNNKIKFTNATQGNANTFLWNFGDGNTSTQENPNKGYAEAGLYYATLTVSDNAGCLSVASAQVLVPVGSKGPSASFNTDNYMQCLVGNNFSFYNNSTYMGAGWNNKYYWYFGDGTVDSSNTFIFNKKYTTAGTFTVTLVAVGSDNCRDTMSLKVQVKSNNCLSFSTPVKLFNQNSDTEFKAAKDSLTSVLNSENGIENWILYPNPNTGIFVLANKKINEVEKIEVVDILGRSINFNSTIYKTENKIEIVLNNSRSGYYFVIIKMNNGVLNRIKFNITN